MDELSPAILQQVLNKIGICRVSPQDLAQLSVLYKAWCRNVPFDNIVDVLTLAACDTAQLTVAHPNDFFARWLEHGTGGLCLPTARAWHSLLRALSFDARFVIATIDEEFPPNHLTVVVRLGSVDYVVDTVNMCERPLILTDHTIAYDDPLVHAVKIQPEGRSWRLRYRTPVERIEQSCRLLEDARSEQFRMGFVPNRIQKADIFQRFNQCNYSRRNTDDGITVVIGKHVIRADLNGKPVIDPEPDLRQVFATELGYAPCITTKLPFYASSD